MNAIKPIILTGLLYLGAFHLWAQSKTIPRKTGDTALTRVDSLKAAIVIAAIRPHLRGDTLEYNTEHIRVAPNALVEELLRRLPGLQIDPDGTITYNGEKIQRLLVDGEDIFGSDPTMVTRNFDASKISKIQVLDRKSDQAIFTGVDDGIRTKTLNLVMKESAKNGYFGKINAGGNTSGNYNTNAALAAFKDKEQFTAIGLAGNMGVLHLNNASAGSQVTFFNGSPDPLGASAGTGIPRFYGLALHYANTWNGPVNHFSGNYQYSHYSTSPVTKTNTIQTLSDTIYRQNQLAKSANRQNQHWGYGQYDWSPSVRSAFQFAFHFSNSQGQNQFTSSESSTFNNALVNASQRSVSDDVNRQNVGGSISYRVKLGIHPDWAISASVGLHKTDIVTKGYLLSQNTFYQSNAITNIDTVDQRKEISDHSLLKQASLAYTQPLWKNSIMALAYELSNTSDNPFQGTYVESFGKYTLLVDSLSSNFQTQQTNQRATISLQGKAAHLSYSLGSNWVNYSYQLQDIIFDANQKIHQAYWAPYLFLNYTFDQATSLRFVYASSSQEPSISQLTPAQNNSNPLLITLGNPNLKPSLTKTFKLDFQTLRSWMLNVSMNMSLINNNISFKTSTDSLGRQISQPGNVNGDKNAGMNLTLTKTILGCNIGFHSALTFARTLNYINSDLNKNDAYISGGGISLSKYVPDKYSIQLHTNFAYFNQLSSINTSAHIHYWSQNHTGSLTLYPRKGFEVNTNATYTWQEKTNAFNSATSLVLWNSYLSKTFLGSRMTIKFQFDNILNENAGFNRTNTGNINTQSTTNILGRYWLLSAIYHFDRKFKKI